MINKKKIACFALASALVIPGAVGLVGCEKKHTHEFDSEPFYEVVLEGESKIARSWRECSCGAEDAHKKVDNAVIATPSTAQSILDGDINGKTIVFDEGDYNSAIELRPSKGTVTIYSYTEEEFETPISNEAIETDGRYTYVRNLENVTFAGTNDAVFKKNIYAESYTMYPSYLTANGGREAYDAVKETELTEHMRYRSVINLKDVTFTGLNLQGGKLAIEARNDYAKNENISITNCKLTTSETVNYQAIVIMSSGSLVQHKNINIRNNKIDGYFQGIYTIQVENIEIENNEIKNTTHNAIALQTNQASNNDPNYYNTGNIIIQNNKISNCIGSSQTGERAIRFGVLKDANIKILDNTFIDCTRASGSLIASQDVATDCSYTFANNTYNGTTLSSKTGTIANATYWEYIV